MKRTVSNTAYEFNKKNYILKKISKTRFERIYTSNRLKQFKTKNIEHSSTK